MSKRDILIITLASALASACGSVQQSSAQSLQQAIAEYKQKPGFKAFAAGTAVGGGWIAGWSYGQRSPDKAVDNALVICREQAAKRGGIGTPCRVIADVDSPNATNLKELSATKPPPSQARSVVDSIAASSSLPSSDWTPVSMDGKRQVKRSTLRAVEPLVTYRFRYGEPPSYAGWLATEYVVEVDCNRRLRRDILTRGEETPVAPFASVDSWGAPFVQELDYVCGWARAQWANSPQTTSPVVAERSPPAPQANVPKARRVTASGSGFFVDRGKVLTNHHVIDDCDELVVRFGDEMAPARLVTATARGDLALLATSKSFGAPATVRTSAALGEDVTVAGYPLSGLLSDDLIVTSGQVNSLAGLRNDPTDLQISAPVQPGNSGGPLLDRSGFVVGVVVAKLDVEKLAKLTGDMAQNVNFAIKPEVLRLFLDTNRVSYKTQALGQRLDGIALAEKARKFTVQVLCKK